MTNPETVSEAFIRWMEDNDYGVFEKDIFLNQVPDYDEDGVRIDKAFWVITSGGDVTTRNVTREQVQEFRVQVNYRNKSGGDVEHILFALNQQVNSRDVLSLEGFDLYSIEASMPEDNDNDVEGRPQALLVVAIQIYVS